MAFGPRRQQRPRYAIIKNVNPQFFHSHSCKFTHKKPFIYFNLYFLFKVWVVKTSRPTAVEKKL